jgi:hypothetical protein
MKHRFYKHKLLLDEGFPPRSYFPIVNQRFDVKHVKDDLRKIGLPDEEVYILALKLKRLIVTYNAKDFRRMAKESQDTGVIGVGALTPYHHIDNKLTALLTKSSQTALQGKYTSLSEVVA